MPVLTGRMTAKQFLDLPEDPDKTRYELVHGEVVVSPSPNLDHAIAGRNLLVQLALHVKARSLGEIIPDTDTYFGPDDVRRPDIMFFSNARSHFIGEQYLEGPPDLCIEILSPSNRHVDRGDKFELYRDSGVSFYWIFDPMLRTVEAYRLSNGQYVEAGYAKDNATVRLAPFDDLEIRLAEIWRPTKSS
ncbi:MAG: Uma2 family endonuclease [Phycisphaerae bacterium]|nr:Uma2 family endonuclease [Tepidisphaeraceae bacterium]